MYAQQTEQKWGKATVHYITPPVEQNNAVHASSGVIDYFILVYHYGISEVDGNHCPFNPSCSRFFLQAVHKTNFFQGLCMFSDRFTRDANIVNRENNYRLDPVTFHFDDPVEKYILK